MKKFSYLNKRVSLEVYMEEQGVLLDCVYCHLIHPELRGDKACPHCHGKMQIFRPAQMMDMQTAQQSMVQDLIPSHHLQSKQYLLGILEKIVIYNFDLKEAIVALIKDLE